MTLSELLLFDPKTKNELIKFVKDRGLSYKVKSYRIEVYGLVLSDFGSVDVAYLRNGSMIRYINVSVKREGVDFADLRELCYGLFGKPYMDNTNHITDNPQIDWKKGHLFAPTYDSAIYLVGAFFDNLKSNPIKHTALQSSLPLFGISMLGGLVWGLLFYLLFGFGVGHTLLLFTLSMGGGVVFGLVMFLALEIVPKFEAKYAEKKRNEKFKKRHVNMLNAYEKESFQGSLSSLARIHYLMGIQLKESPARIFIDNGGIHIVYVKGRSLKERSILYSEIQYFTGSMYQPWITIFSKDESVVNLSQIEKSYDEIIGYIEAKLGYDSERTLAIEELVYNTILEFDPCSIIALGGDPSQFRESSKCIARRISLMDDPNYENVNLAIVNVIDEELPIFEELNNKIYNGLVEAGLI